MLDQFINEFFVLMVFPPLNKVAMFAVLGMVLRRKPDVLLSQLPILRDSAKY